VGGEGIGNGGNKSADFLRAETVPNSPSSNSPC